MLFLYMRFFNCKVAMPERSRQVYEMSFFFYENTCILELSFQQKWRV